MPFLAGMSPALVWFYAQAQPITDRDLRFQLALPAAREPVRQYLNFVLQGHRRPSLAGNAHRPFLCLGFAEIVTLVEFFRRLALAWPCQEVVCIDLSQRVRRFKIPYRFEVPGAPERIISPRDFFRWFGAQEHLRGRLAIDFTAQDVADFFAQQGDTVRQLHIPMDEEMALNLLLQHPSTTLFDAWVFQHRERLIGQSSAENLEIFLAERGMRVFG